jgi:hypothetical protein
MLACVRGHTRTPAKPHKSGVYDCGGVSYLSCAQGSCISCSGGEIRWGMRGVLRARIWCAFTSISPLAAVVLRLGAASLDFLAYVRIEPHFDLCNYFFHAQLLSGSDAEATVWGSVDIFVQSRLGVNPYFRFPTSGPLAGWWKVWFFLRNDADAPLPIFTGCRPIPQPKWQYHVAQQYVHMLQPLCDIIR